MTVPDPASADAVSVILAWLQRHPRITAEFGAGAVSGVVEGPWPHLRVSPGPGGNIGDLRTNAPQQEVVLEVFDSPTSAVGQAATWRLAQVAVHACGDLNTYEPQIGDTSVVCDVRGNGSVAYQQMTSGQSRWVVSILVTLYPAAGLL